MHTSIRSLILFVMIAALTVCIAQAEDDYDKSFVLKQTKSYSFEKATDLLKKGDPGNAAIHILSLYPIFNLKSLHLALSLRDHVDTPLPQYLFEAFQQCVVIDQTLREKVGEEKKINGIWMAQKGMWTDKLIAEVMAYEKLEKEHIQSKHELLEFYFGAFHDYFTLNSEEAMGFVEKFDKASETYQILKAFSDVAMRRQAPIEALEKIDDKKLSKALKEMLATLKGHCYFSNQNATKAKEAYLSFFELNYSLPVHIENLANCHMADGSYQKAKPLYLHLSGLIQSNNISASGIYNLACIFSTEGDKDKAFAHLEEAIKRGFPKSHAIKDDDLKSLREDERFKRLME